MKVAIIFHMPEIFDTGWAKKVYDCLKTHHEVFAVVHGTMGRTAVLDNFMEREVMLDKRKPSECLKEVSRVADAIVIASHPTSPQKGHAFCWRLIKASNINKPVVEVETKSGTVITWNSDKKDLALLISEKLGLKTEKPADFGVTLWTEGKRKYRRVLGVDLGDYVLINKVVVGKAISDNVILVEEGGFLVDVLGVKFKAGGIERVRKFGKIDIEKVIVDTAPSLRFTYKEPRIIKGQAERTGVIFIDHLGYQTYELASGAEGVVVVGDDTVAIVGDILYRLQVPLLGIVDGDADGLLSKVHTPQASLIVTVRNDDAAGAKVFREIFNHQVKIAEKFAHVRTEILKLIKDDVIRLLKFNLRLSPDNSQ